MFFGILEKRFNLYNENNFMILSNRINNFMFRIVFNVKLCSNLEYNFCKIVEFIILRVKYCIVDFRY